LRRRGRKNREKEGKGVTGGKVNKCTKDKKTPRETDRRGVRKGKFPI